MTSAAIALGVIWRVPSKKGWFVGAELVVHQIIV